MTKSFKAIILMLLLSNFYQYTFSQTKNSKTMKVQQGQLAPDFQTQDVFGNDFSMTKLRGQKILLSFMRNAGCPICNLRVHELLNKADSLKAKNITVVLIYQSSKENMLAYLAQEKLPFTFIADAKNELYKLYSIQGGMGKMMNGMFHGAMGKMKKGKKLFKTKIKQDGPMNTIGSDFLIDEQGKIIKANYGKFLGDHLAPQEILQIF